MTAEWSLPPQIDKRAQLEAAVEVFDLRVWAADAERLVVSRPPLCFIADATTSPQDRCKRYAVFAAAEGEDVDSEGQVEAAERAIDHARDFLKKIDDACAEWAEEVEKARQEEEAEEMRREEAACEENA